LGLAAKVKGKVVAKENRAYKTTTSSMRMEVEAVSRAFFWLERCQFIYVVFFTDSLRMLRKIETGMFRAEWLESLNKTKMVGITWIYCPRYAGVRGNKEADRLAVSAPVGGQLLHGKRNVIGALWDKAWWS
jgi:ribonuclease HI